MTGFETRELPFTTETPGDWTGSVTPAHVRHALDQLASRLAAMEAGIISPIGAIVAWHKSFANTPALPAGWVECDGSVLSDSASVYDGQTIPDLNGDGAYIKGAATSGTVTGAHTKTIAEANLPSHTHAYESIVSAVAPGFKNVRTGALGKFIAETKESRTSGATGSGTALNIEPKNYTMVWIMRVK